MHFLGLIPAQRPLTPLTMAVVTPEASQTAFQFFVVANNNWTTMSFVWVLSQVHKSPVSWLLTRKLMISR